MSTAAEMKHTPGKLSMRPAGLLATDEGNVRFVARVEGHGPDGELTPQDVADGERLALAWNCHDELVEALAEVLRTGLNGGNNYRLAMMAASRNVLDDATLEKAEASERAVNKAYAAINKALGKE